MRAFEGQFPYIHVFGAWNEPNLATVTAKEDARTYLPPSRPGTFLHEPASGAPIAARYWVIADEELKDAVVVAGEFTSSNGPNVGKPYWQKYLEALGSHRKDATVWGIHPYSDVRKQYQQMGDTHHQVTSDFNGTLESFMKGSNPLPSGTKIWLTEVGADNLTATGETGWKNDQAKGVEFLIKTMGSLPRVARIYYYNFQTEGTAADPQDWDRGLIDVNRNVRDAFRRIVALRGRYWRP
jgi:hypothetical protein